MGELQQLIKGKAKGYIIIDEMVLDKIVEEMKHTFPKKTDYSHERFDILTPEMIYDGFFNAHSYLIDLWKWFEKWLGNNKKIREMSSPEGTSSQ